MTCQEFWSTMPELEGEAAPEAAAHGRECTACAAVLNHHGALAAGLRGGAAEWGRLKAPGRVEARLLAEFRGQAGLAAPPPVRRWWSPVLAWTAAALVVAAASAPASPSSSGMVFQYSWQVISNPWPDRAHPVAWDGGPDATSQAAGRVRDAEIGRAHV